MQFFKTYRIFLQAFGIVMFVVLLKLVLHHNEFELIEPSSLQNSVVSSAFFVIGFVLSATIADYKESERIPAEFASTIEDMYNDAEQIHRTYTKFDLEHFRKSLVEVLDMFRDGTRKDRLRARRELAELQVSFAEMESAGVPPNFVTKLKQQQSQLMRSLFRVNYIQRIKFIPSAYLLIQLIFLGVVGMLLQTRLENLTSGMVIVAVITFVMAYMVLLINHISVPFRAKGSSQDDVSLFLLRESREYLQQRKEEKYGNAKK